MKRSHEKSRQNNQRQECRTVRPSDEESVVRQICQTVLLLQLRFHEIVSPDKVCSGVSVYHRLLYLQFCIGML